MPAQLAYATIGTLVKIHRTDTLDGAGAAVIALLIFLFLWFGFRDVHNVRQDDGEYVFKPKFLWKVIPFPFAALGVWIFLDSAAVFWFRVAMGLGICASAIGAYPKVIRFDDAGISSKNWMGRPIHIHWNAITEVRRTPESRYSSRGYLIRDSDGMRFRVLDMVYDTDSMIDILRSKVKIKVDDRQATIKLKI
jgi:hypothetical protein